MKRQGASGFTLVELMIVVAIIGTLSAVAAPKFGSLLSKAHEGASKGSLGMIRSALLIYYADMEGQYPGLLGALTVNAKYLPALPEVEVPKYHGNSTAVHYGLAASDAGGWSYNNTAGDQNQGTVLVNCTHKDSKGTIWATY